MRRFGTHLRELRHQRGLTLEATARRAEIQKGYLSGIELNLVNPPSPPVIRALARILGTPKRQLLLMAVIEKAPKEIRKDLENAFTPILGGLL